MRQLNILECRNGFQVYLTDDDKLKALHVDQRFVAMNTENLGILVRDIMEGKYELKGKAEE